MNNETIQRKYPVIDSNCEWGIPVASPLILQATLFSFCVPQANIVSTLTCDTLKGHYN